MENRISKHSTRWSLSSLCICWITEENKTAKFKVCCKTVCKKNKRLKPVQQMICNELFTSIIHTEKPPSLFTHFGSYFRIIFESNSFALSACQNLLCKHLAFYAHLPFIGGIISTLLIWKHFPQRKESKLVLN